MDKNRTVITLMLLIGCGITEIYYLAAFLPYNNSIDWFIFPPPINRRPDTFWYLRNMSEIVRNILWVSAVYRLGRMNIDRIGRKLVRVIWLVRTYTWIELGLFFLCFQRYGHGLLLILTAILSWIILSPLKKESVKYK